MGGCRADLGWVVTASRASVGGGRSKIAPGLGCVPILVVLPPFSVVGVPRSRWSVGGAPILVSSPPFSVVGVPRSRRSVGGAPILVGSPPFSVVGVPRSLGRVGCFADLGEVTAGFGGGRSKIAAWADAARILVGWLPPRGRRSVVGVPRSRRGLVGVPILVGLPPFSVVGVPRSRWSVGGAPILVSSPPFSVVGVPRSLGCFADLGEVTTGFGGRRSKVAFAVAPRSAVAQRLERSWATAVGARGQCADNWVISRLGSAWVV